ncbi:MAG: rhodanese-like domain-containing protein, partial [Clostridia bacterium]
ITENISVTVNPHGTVVFLIKSGNVVSVPDVNEALEYKKPKDIEKISLDKANELISNGAVLIDVRSKNEYESGHLDSAVNAPYTEIHVAASSLVPNKKQKIIVYCSTGKRSSQAKYTLDYMGYKNVFYLGGIEL